MSCQGRFLGEALTAIVRTSEGSLPGVLLHVSLEREPRAECNITPLKGAGEALGAFPASSRGPTPTFPVDLHCRHCLDGSADESSRRLSQHRDDRNSGRSSSGEVLGRDAMRGRGSTMAKMVESRREGTGGGYCSNHVMWGSSDRSRHRGYHDMLLLLLLWGSAVHGRGGGSSVRDWPWLAASNLGVMRVVLLLGGGNGRWWRLLLLLLGMIRMNCGPIVYLLLICWGTARINICWSG
mmetsp:Transcript_37441/g.60113  ORF Transcript_37441/g.60113 Transcript_37441/m.60113 type:complete len:238 (-) Transcript_37441:273-986(-)